MHLQLIYIDFCRWYECGIEGVFVSQGEKPQKGSYLGYTGQRSVGVVNAVLVVKMKLN